MNGRRNLEVAERISATPVQYPFSFVIAGDSGAWPDPTADAIYAQLLRQIARLAPAPLYLANLGDFAGPGTLERHHHYLQLVHEVPIPNLCAIGNHDLDDPRGPEAWAHIHGPRNLDFTYGHTRFVILDAAPGKAGEIDVEGPDGVEGPDQDALAYLDRCLQSAAEPHRVVLMHAPPRFNGRFAPHPEWGFNVREQAFSTSCTPPRRPRLLRARAPVRPPHPPWHPVCRHRRRRHWHLLTSARHLRPRARAPRRPRSTVSRRADHHHRSRRHCRPSPASLRPRRRTRSLHLRRHPQNLSLAVSLRPGRGPRCA
jgi:hypothetical protein